MKGLEVNFSQKSESSIYFSYIFCGYYYYYFVLNQMKKRSSNYAALFGCVR